MSVMTNSFTYETYFRTYALHYQNKHVTRKKGSAKDSLYNIVLGKMMQEGRGFARDMYWKSLYTFHF